MVTTVDIETFRQSAGRELEPSAWMEITQDRINQFADATDDHQFIHVDPEQAAKTPFGGTIAHGFLTLSMMVTLNSDTALHPEGMTMAVNYGSNKVRFMAPVPVGSRIRSTQKIVKVDEKGNRTFLVTTAVSIEIEGSPKPAMMAEVLTLYFVS
jgi:acyl dehydratase